MLLRGSFSIVARHWRQGNNFLSIYSCSTLGSTTACAWAKQGELFRWLLSLNKFRVWARCRRSCLGLSFSSNIFLTCDCTRPFPINQACVLALTWKKWPTQRWLNDFTRSTPTPTLAWCCLFGGRLAQSNVFWVPRLRFSAPTTFRLSGCNWGLMITCTPSSRRLRGQSSKWRLVTWARCNLLYRSLNCLFGYFSSDFAGFLSINHRRVIHRRREVWSVTLFCRTSGSLVMTSLWGMPFTILLRVMVWLLSLSTFQGAFKTRTL